MERLGRSLQAAAGRIWRWFFPAEVELPEALHQLLAFLYPGLDRRGALFHLGFPHFLNVIPNQAITLPATLLPGRARVYIHPDSWDPGSVRGLGLVVHEAYHILQVQESWRGWGLGLLHPFTVLYVACAAANRFRYDGHPMETDAYRVAGLPQSVFEGVVDPAAVPAEQLRRRPPCREAIDLTALEQCCHPAVTPDSGLAFWQKLAASTPGWTPLARAARRLLGPPASGWLRRALGALPAVLLLAGGGLLVGLWLLLWTAAVVVLWAAQLLTEGLGALAAGLLWALGALLRFPGRLLAGRPSRRAPDRT